MAASALTSIILRVRAFALTCLVLFASWILWVPPSLFAQGPPPTTIQAQNVQVNPQAPVNQIAAATVTASKPGTATYYYWIVSNNSPNYSRPAGPFVVLNAPNTLSGSANVTVAWQPVSGVNFYDLLRTTSTVAPTGACACAVSIGVANTTIVDSSNSLSAYSVNAMGSPHTIVNQIYSGAQTLEDCYQGTCLPIGSGSGSSSPNMNLVYLASACASGETNCFALGPSGFQQVGCSSTASSAAIVCPSGTFSSADVGFRAALYQTCKTNAAAYSVDAGAAAGTTILSVTDSAHATLSANAAATQASGCLFAAPIEDTVLSAADSAAQAFPTCPKVQIAAGIWAAETSHFLVVPTSCANTPNENGVSNSAAVYVIAGQGQNQTFLWMPPDFESSLAGCTNGIASLACWIIPGNTEWQDWQLTGGGYPSSGSAAHALIEVDPAAADAIAWTRNFSCTNFGMEETGMYGISVGLYELRMNYSSIDGCGGVEASATLPNATGGGALLSFQSAFQDGGGTTQVEGGIGTIGQFVSLGGTYIGSTPLAPATSNLTRGPGILLRPDDSLDTNGNTSTLRCWLGLNTGDYFASNGASCDSATGIFIQNTGAKLTLQNTNLAGPVLVNSGATATVYDLGGNTTSAFVDNGSAAVYGDASITGAAQAAANITPSMGWGTSGAAGNGVSGVTGSTRAETFTITATGTPASTCNTNGTCPTVAIIFPVAFWGAPSGGCTANQIGGTGVTSDAIPGTPTATGVSFTYDANPISGDTYVFRLVCSNP